MAFNNLLDILKKVQSRYPAFGKRLEEAEALGRWDAAVGQGIAKHSRAVKVQDSVLWVEVDHSIWKSELHHRKRQILEILNQGKAGDEILKDLFFIDSKAASRSAKPTRT
jgi:predicted nucleic acid-binding Zn ribbon protein